MYIASTIKTTNIKHSLFIPMKIFQNAILLLLVIIGFNLHAQDRAFSGKSIRTGIGIGINEGHWETGMGLIYSFGIQKSYGEKQRLRLNPNIIVGGFTPLMITDTRDQFYRMTSLGLNLHYDLIKYKAVSLVTTAGAFVNYSRGLLGTGGWPEANNNHSEYFYKMYCGANLSAAIRVDPKNSRLAYELRPISIQFGNDYFFLGYYMFGIDIKLGNN